LYKKQNTDNIKGMQKLRLVSSKDKAALERAIEQGAILYVEPSPSTKQQEYFVHEFEDGNRGRLTLIGRRRAMNVFEPVVTGIKEAGGGFFQLTIENLSHLVGCPSLP